MSAGQLVSCMLITNYLMTFPLGWGYLGNRNYALIISVTCSDCYCHLATDIQTSAVQPGKMPEKMAGVEISGQYSLNGGGRRG